MPNVTVQVTDCCADNLRGKRSLEGHQAQKQLQAAFAQHGLTIALKEPHLDRLKGKDRKEAHGALVVSNMPTDPKKIAGVLQTFEALSMVRRVVLSTDMQASANSKLTKVVMAVA